MTGVAVVPPHLAVRLVDAGRVGEAGRERVIVRRGHRVPGRGQEGFRVGVGRGQEGRAVIQVGG